MRREIHLHRDAPELARAAAQMIVRTIAAAVARQGRCALALAGGNTPSAVYRLLAQPPYRDQVPWSHLHLFWGDERMVPPEHPDSNFGMAHAAWLAQVPVPASHLHRVKGELPPQQAVQEYAAELQRFFVSGDMRFDLILLGLGEDGHTASLFPATSAAAEQQLPVTAVYAPRLGQWRVTMTLPLLNAARAVVFLVTGAHKAAITAQVLALAAPDPRWPATLVRPVEGELHYMLDAAAAAQLPRQR